MSASDPAPTVPTAIPRPRLVLRVGFAGKREFWNTVFKSSEPTEQDIRVLGESIQLKLREVFQVIGDELIEIAPHTPCQHGNSPAISAYYARQNPLLRVITGLCEGADTLAFKAAELLGSECLDVEQAAVIGFPLEEYRSSREPGFLTEFDRQAALSACILVADGKYDPIREDDPDASAEAKSLAKTRRNRGYRCQSNLLLRQTDLLVTLVDPTDSGKAGGTLETIHKSLALQIPVVIVNPNGLGVSLHSSGENLEDSVEGDSDSNWKSRLASRVRHIVANPVLSDDAFHNEQSSHSSAILEEFFNGHPPSNETGNPMLNWDTFANFFAVKSKTEVKKGDTSPYQLPSPEAFLTKDGYSHYRDWAAELASHYGTRFRNAFFHNTLFALCAVFLAGVCLLLLVHSKGQPSLPIQAILIFLACGKICLVAMIYRSAHRANHDHWNDRLVDYRYFSERMRTMLHLPGSGSWLPPAASPQYASRVIRQSAVDWLADAIIRSLPPAAWHRDDDPPRQVVLRWNEALAGTLAWLKSQHGYHRKNALKMQRMERWLRALGEFLNSLVLVIVAIDILLLVTELLALACHWHEHPFFHLLSKAAPFIVFITAIIPAAVAAVNVIRLQSECERLSERSTVMLRQLGGRRKIDPDHVQEHPAHPATPPSFIRRIQLFFALQRENLRIVRDPRDQLSRKTAPHSQMEAVYEGGRLQEAHALQHLLQSEAEQHLGARIGKVLLFTEGCAEIFTQEVAEWSVLYAKELVEP